MPSSRSASHPSDLAAPLAAQAAVLVAVLAVVLTGCGGEPADPGLDAGADGVTQVVVSFAAGLRDGDGPRACSFLAPSAQDALAKKYPGTNCLASIRNASTDAADLGDLTKAEISVDGNAATVKGSAARKVAAVLGVSSLQLVRDEEHWMIR